MGLRSSPIGEVVLENVRVPASAMLGEPGAGTVAFTQSMEWERVCIAAKHVGTMRRLLEKSIQYARTREAFGVKIGKHQAVAHKIVDMKIRLEAARLLTYKAAAGLDRARDVAIDASSVKVFASEALVQTALDTVQIFGGNGFMTEYEVERTLRDAGGQQDLLGDERDPAQHHRQMAGTLSQRRFHRRDRRAHSRAGRGHRSRRSQ
jgi:alkylation response protein AidB-like acyl-CoA dehydrogenase